MRKDQEVTEYRHIEEAAPTEALRGLVRHGLFTYASNAAVLGVNIITGVLIARVLGTSGRGELTAISALPALLAWFFSMGCGSAVQFHQARHPEDAPRLLSTWLLILIPLTLLAVMLGEAFLPLIFAAQTAISQQLAGLYLSVTCLAMLAELTYGVLLGDQDFLFFNAARVGQPVILTASYLVLWHIDRFSVSSALLATAASGALLLTIATVRALRRHGLGTPSLTLAMSTLWYGVRGHGTGMFSIINVRLDMLIIPAFLSASAIGLYAVATTVSWLVVSLAAPLAAILLPAAARGGSRATQTVLYSLHVTAVVSIAFAICLAIGAEVAINIIYGTAFATSALLVRLLIPGTVFYSMATILSTGLYVANRPFTAAVAQASGIIVTVPGLLLLLRPSGIVAAALVSTVSYTVVFVTTTLLYRSATRLGWRSLLPSNTEWSLIQHGLRRRRHGAVSVSDTRNPGS